MARPVKEGLDYFPMDTDFLFRRDIKLIRGSFGIKGVYIVLALMMELHRTKGYYLEWGADDSVLMSEDVARDCSPGLITDVVRACLKRQFFDEGIFERYGVLTSADIQRRYIRAVSKRDVISIINEYWMLDFNDPKDVPPNILNRVTLKSVSGGMIPFPVTDKIVSGTGNTQSKEKESKVNESKVNEIKENEIKKDILSSSRTTHPVPFGEIIDLFNSVCVSLLNVNSLSDARRKAVTARYRDCNNSCEKIKSFFERVEESDFLTGRTSGVKGGWTATFDWIMREENFIKIQEGSYDNSVRPSHRTEKRYPPEYDISGIGKMFDEEWRAAIMSENRKN